MVHRASNQSFALVRDKSTGLDFWEVWDERMPFGSHHYKIIVVVHDFWFAAGDDGDWIGPYHSREQACAFQHEHRETRRAVPLLAHRSGFLNLMLSRPV
jgi:hypothetical protein